MSSSDVVTSAVGSFRSAAVTRLLIWKSRSLASKGSWAEPERETVKVTSLPSSTQVFAALTCTAGSVPSLSYTRKVTVLGNAERYSAASSTVTVSSPVSVTTLSSTVEMTTSTEVSPGLIVADVGIAPVVKCEGTTAPKLTVNGVIASSFARDGEYHGLALEQPACFDEERRTEGNSSSRTVILWVNKPSLR